MINNDIEYKSVEEIKTFQEGLLHEALVYLKNNSPYYQRMFKSYGINIEKIRHIEDLVKIPFTEKKDLQPGEKPAAVFEVTEPVIAAYEYCNLHGLWKAE